MPKEVLGDGVRVAYLESREGCNPRARVVKLLVNQGVVIEGAPNKL